jgi:release factor glutamine methyltransferase
MITSSQLILLVISAFVIADATVTVKKDAQYKAMLSAGRLLQENRYNFVTITPESHKRVLARTTEKVNSLRDVFGWSRSFTLGEAHKAGLNDSMINLLQENDILSSHNDLLKSNVRFSSAASLHQKVHADLELLFMHSSFPTDQENSIFFGPDSYRYLIFLRDHVGTRHFKSAIDIGAGSGVGGLFFCNSADNIVLTDINDVTFKYAAVNARLNNCKSKVTFIKSDIMKSLSNQKFDLIVSNPPYMVDTSREKVRVYRNGGGNRGIELSVRIVRESIPHLEDGGIFALYTGVPIVNGIDVFWEEIKDELLRSDEFSEVKYYEIDADVWGEELSTDVYGDVDRIAVTGLVIKKK